MAMTKADYVTQGKEDARSRATPRTFANADSWQARTYMDALHNEQMLMFAEADKATAEAKAKADIEAWAKEDADEQIELMKVQPNDTDEERRKKVLHATRTAMHHIAQLRKDADACRDIERRARLVAKINSLTLKWEAATA